MKSYKSRFIVLTCAISLFAYGCVFKKKPQKTTPAPATTATTTPPAAAPAKPADKKYSDVITKDKVTYKGFIDLHKVGDKFYFEIPDSIFNRDLLMVGRFSATGSNMKDRGEFFGFAGDEMGSDLLQFEIQPGNKVFLKRMVSANLITDSTDNLTASVKRSNMDIFLNVFPIAVKKSDTNNVVIDITDWITKDEAFAGLNEMLKKTIGLGAPKSDLTIVRSAKAYPINIEFDVLRTYSFSGMRAAQTATFGTNTSIVLLPKTPMKARKFDERVGIFATPKIDFQAYKDKRINIEYADRFRLEPKPEDVQKYLRGELVEPQKPIVFYIDRATPKELIPYFIKGVDAWNIAFEKAGFKNAIKGILAPTPQEDSTFSLYDARHSAIVYHPSSTENAMGPHVVDPRSGEVIESHIIWYHHMSNILKQWIYMQVAPNFPELYTLNVPEKLIGRMVEYVITHEVGHTLGLHHNFIANNSTPVDSLRSKTYIAKYGINSSLMDYSRLNYVAQKEDNLPIEMYFPTIGDYDIWAIEWNYRWTPDTYEKDVLAFDDLTTERLKNPRLRWAAYKPVPDPRTQTEDIGDDPLKASVYGINKIKALIPTVPNWAFDNVSKYDDMMGIYDMSKAYYGMFLNHVAAWVGGYYYEDIHPKSGKIEMKKPVEVAKQKAAIDWMKKYVLEKPTWFYNKQYGQITGVTERNFFSSFASARAMNLLSGRLLQGLFDQQQDRSQPSVGLGNYLNTFTTEIFTRSRMNDEYYRQMQIAYVNGLINAYSTKRANLAKTFNVTVSSENVDFSSIVAAQLSKIRTNLQAVSGDEIINGHKNYLIKLITDGLNFKAEPVLILNTPQ
ncbi:zinc-dependent metalloprotease [Gynurincola endophyticus]|uniref:zinc-dependent metalloprotease n=1 Tax=Gynurincola endophyticus TaxID=2479004 RepID=UPI000F8E3C22|nr:zinc-dependent metalloprotease [Gynurincola endophyticus]